MVRYTDPSRRTQLATLQHKFSETQQLANSLPTKIPQIDWSYWASSIKTPGVVEHYKKLYENEQKKEVKVNEQELSASQNAYKQEIAQLEKSKEKSIKFIDEIKAYKQTLEEDRAKIENIEHTHGDLFARHPGLLEQYRNEMHEGEYGLHEEVEKLDNVDLVELRRQLEAGNVKSLGALSSLPPPKNLNLGPFNDQEWKYVPFDEKDASSNLVYRAKQIKALL